MIRSRYNILFLCAFYFIFTEYASMLYSFFPLVFFSGLIIDEDFEYCTLCTYWLVDNVADFIEETTRTTDYVNGVLVANKDEIDTFSK